MESKMSLMQYSVIIDESIIYIIQIFVIFFSL